MAPDNERLERLIETAFERLPEPAPARLKAGEDRLVSALPQPKRPRSGWYWWLIATLVTSGAAAWWTGQYFKSPDTVPHTPSAPAGNRPNGAPNVTTPEPNEQPPRTVSPPRSGQSPDIYRRERY